MRGLAIFVKWVCLAFCTLFNSVGNAGDIQSAFSENCGSPLLVQEDIYLEPVVSIYSNRGTEFETILRPVFCSDAERIYSVAFDGELVAHVKVYITDSSDRHIDINTKLFAKKFRWFSLSLQAVKPSLGRLFVPQQLPITLMSADQSDNTFYYPFDWREPNLLTLALFTASDLVTPGASIDGAWFLSKELGFSTIETKTDGQSVSLKINKLRTVLSQYDGDLHTERYLLRRGGTISLDTSFSSNYGIAQSRRFGSYSSPIMSGSLTHMQYRTWASPNFGLDANQLEYVSSNLAENIDHVVYRAYAPTTEIAASFKDKGLKLYFYQFLGAVRFTGFSESGDLETIHGSLPYDWYLYGTDSRTSFDSELQSAAMMAADMSLSTDELKDHGGWLLLDIRRNEVREFLVSNAVEAIRNGWNGIFFDGPLDWLDDNLNSGGNGLANTYLADERISWVEARNRLLIETKIAIRLENRDSILGVLAPGIYATDIQNIADFTYRERINSNWVNIADDPRLRYSEVNRGISDFWETYSREYLRKNLYTSIKTANPTLARTGLKWFSDDSRRNSLKAYEYGDFRISDSFEYSNSIGLQGFDGPIIESVVPSESKIISKGYTKLEVTENSTISFDRAIPIWENGEYKGVNSSYLFGLGESYRIPDFYDATFKVWWSNSGLLFRNSNWYIFSSLEFVRSPVFRAGSYFLETKIGVENAPIIIRSINKPRIYLRSNVYEDTVVEIETYPKAGEQNVWETDTIDAGLLGSSNIIHNDRDVFSMEVSIF